MKLRNLLILLLSIAVIAAACGDDDDSSGGDVSDSPIAQALAAEMMEDGDSPFANEEDANCFAAKAVNDIGEDRLIELGVTADNVGSIDSIDFSEGELDTIVDAMDDCVDLGAAIAAEMGEGMPEEAVKCLGDELDGDMVKSMMRAGLAGDDVEPPDDFIQSFLDIAAKCDLPLG